MGLQKIDTISYRLNYMSISSAAHSIPEDHGNDVAAPKNAARINGRPRSEKSMQAILDATNKMLLHAPVREVSIEAVAKKAGVGKTTIYRWWPNKVALILDAITGPMNVLPAPVSGGNAKDLLVKQMERFARICRGRGGKVIAEVYSEAQGNGELQSLFFQKFMLQHEEILASILDQGKVSGDFRATLDTPLAVDMIYGTVFYHLMSSPEPLDQNFTDKLIIESLRIVA
ncbi:MAG: TetR/AcrR family transcriptional regulator [Pseudomonadota bacterium]